MSQTASAIVQKVWNYAHVLKDDGLAFMDYTEQITYLLFMKMAWEQREAGASRIPALYTWGALKKISDNKKLWIRYHQGLRKLSGRKDLIGLIFTKPQSKINDPAKLHLLIQMIDSENWSDLDLDVKGEVYEGLLARNAEDVRGGAGQYFTPRPVIRAIVDVIQPEPMMRISDPACGTGGFLLAAFEYLKRRLLHAEEESYLRKKALHGVDLVPNVARLCAMNLFLHGIGTDPDHPVVSIDDSLGSPAEPADIVLTNPPFGIKSSVTIIGKDGKKLTDKMSYKRQDFWLTTSNKQLNFLQHVYSMLVETGRAAMVVPDNVLFEAGAGEKIRRALLSRCEVHTLLRLPTGIWYSPGVKANVLFFDKKPAAKTPWTRDLWIYDLRTNRNFTLRNNPITDADLIDFVQCAQPGKPITKRKENDRFKRFTYADLMARDKANLDIFWLKDDSLGDTENLPQPHVLAAEIVEDLEKALEEFSAVEEELKPGHCEL
jgi:type I restriction enzyme M protein